jgi:hypothetical protein
MKVEPKEALADELVDGVGRARRVDREHFVA